MANMLLKSNKDSYTTKASCHCGRKVCSAERKAQRKTARRIEKNAIRNELKGI